MRAFDQALRSTAASGRPLILDGALGTELDNRGADTSTPAWSGLAPLHHPEILAEIHREYVAAGASIIATCTWRTSKRAFDRAGLKGQKWREATAAAVAIARRSVAGSGTLVAGSVGPLEDCFQPSLAPSGPSAVAEHAMLMEVLVQEGVDLLWLETFGAVGELDAAMEAARGATADEDIPFMVSVTTSRDGNLISGGPLQQAAALAESRGAAAFCVNCIPPAHVEVALKRLREATTLPIGVYANLGVPEPSQDWIDSTHRSPGAYAELSRTWKVDLIGACCGSTPAHIQALHDMYYS